MADYRYVQVEREGRVLIVTMNRPEVMNALHPPANAELGEVFDQFGADPDVWVAILTGAGDRAFSAGSDLKWLATGGDPKLPPRGWGGLSLRHDLDKPVIAAVNGVAMGGGLEIALACDLIVAAENAVFALPESLVGRVAVPGALHLLSRQIPLKQAMGMALTGRRVGAEEGQKLGFVNEVVPEGQALAGARRWAEAILKCAPRAVQGTKQVIREGANLTYHEASGRDYPAVVAHLASADALEGPRAFAEKRPRVWTGL